MLSQRDREYLHSIPTEIAWTCPALQGGHVGYSWHTGGSLHPASLSIKWGKEDLFWLQQYSRLAHGGAAGPAGRHICKAQKPPKLVVTPHHHTIASCWDLVSTIESAPPNETAGN
jgi:hypothetical protein